MGASLTLPAGTGLFVHARCFELEHDAPLPELLLPYELSGEPGAPLIVVQGGISADPHVTETAADPRAGWWSPIVGPGRAIDTRRFRVLSIEFLGRREERVVSSGDQARATALLLDSLGIERVHAFVGASYGGMVALSFASLFPRRVERLVAISAPDRPRVFATAWRALQRRVLDLGRAHGASEEAVVIARAMGMVSYRSAAELERRFAGDGAVESYLLARGRDFAARFDGDALARLSLAIDLHRCDVTRIMARATLIAADPDLLVPSEQLERLAPRFGRPARFVRVPSEFGHDAFLKEIGPVGAAIAEALDGRPARAAATIAARHGIASDPAHGAVVPPIHLSTNYTFEGFGRRRKYDYTRTANPTRDLLAGALAELEGGAGAVVTSSGMSALTLALQLVPAGGLVVAPHDGYGGTWRLLRALEAKGLLRVELADLTDPETRAAALSLRPSLVLIETPSNPLLRITDLAAACAEAKAAGAQVAVDNTFLSPLLQRPIEFGADLVVHSTTKYLNGHSDVVGGAVIAADATLVEQLSWWSNCLGLSGAPFDSFLTLRGVRTLAARMRVHEENALRVAAFLAGDPRVARVFHPSLPSHPGHELARRQQSGFGAMLSFELADASAVAAFLGALRCFSLAESLGGVESLVAHPATMTHAAMDGAARERAGITPRLLRLSIGIEDGDDLIADLDQALAASAASRSPALS